MTYLSAKKIYPGNWVNALNGWYKNTDANPVDGTNDGTVGGPTSVLAVPGYRYFQQRGYVPVTATSGVGAVASASIIVPSPYRQDDTRTDITGMVISGSAAQPAFIYRTAVSIASGWDNRAASGVYASSGNIISFGRNVGTATSATGTAASGVGEAVAQANVLAAQGASAGAAGIFFSGTVQAFGANPFITATGAAGVSGAICYYAATTGTTFGVFAKGAVNDTAASGGVFISDADVAAGRVGYIVTEVCYLRPDDAPAYEDIDSYLNNRTVS
jgi:hypothetical protein